MKAKVQTAFSDRLNKLQIQIENIKARSEQVPAQYVIEFERQLDLLFAKHNLAMEKLERLQQADGAEWEEIKSSLDGICNEIENALDSAAAKIG